MLQIVMQTESHNTQSVYSTVLSAERNWQYTWQLTEWQTYCNRKLNVTTVTQTESHNTHSVYSTVLLADPNWQYSWQSTEWQTYCNRKLNVTNCNTNWKPQNTVCIQHCTVSWTKLTVQLTVNWMTDIL
jgi:hypothetical protein